jgi:hypothetical protein
VPLLRPKWPVIQRTRGYCSGRGPLGYGTIDDVISWGPAPLNIDPLLVLIPALGGVLMHLLTRRNFSKRASSAISFALKSMRAQPVRIYLGLGRHAEWVRGADKHRAQSRAEAGPSLGAQPRRVKGADAPGCAAITSAAKDRPAYISHLQSRTALGTRRI